MSQPLTERLPILVSPGDLAAWKQRATDDGISTAEFVRNAAATALTAPKRAPLYTEAEVEAMAAQLAVYAPGMRQMLEQTTQAIDAAMARIAADRAATRSTP